MLSYFPYIHMIEGGQSSSATQAEVPCPANKENGLSRCNSHEETGFLSTVQGIISMQIALLDYQWHARSSCSCLLLTIYN